MTTTHEDLGEAVNLYEMLRGQELSDAQIAEINNLLHDGNAVGDLDVSLREMSKQLGGHVTFGAVVEKWRGVQAARRLRVEQDRHKRFKEAPERPFWHPDAAEWQVLGMASVKLIMCKSAGQVRQHAARMKVCVDRGQVRSDAARALFEEAFRWVREKVPCRDRPRLARAVLSWPKSARTASGFSSAGT